MYDTSQIQPLESDGERRAAKGQRGWQFKMAPPIVLGEGALGLPASEVMKVAVTAGAQDLSSRDTPSVCLS